MATTRTRGPSPYGAGGSGRGATGLAPPALTTDGSGDSYNGGDEPWDKGGGGGGRGRGSSSSRASASPNKAAAVESGYNPFGSEPTATGGGGGRGRGSSRASASPKAAVESGYNPFGSEPTGDGGDGGANYRDASRRGRKAAGRGSTPHSITSTAGGDSPTAASTAAAAAALAAASGGPAAPSADVGTEVSPAADSFADGDPYPDSGGGAAGGGGDRARSPFSACVDDASTMFREKVNCEFYEEHKTKGAEDSGDLPSLSLPAHRRGTSPVGQPKQQQQQQQPVGGRVVTVGGQTKVTMARSLSPPSKKGVREIIEDSEGTAQAPSPMSRRKQEAFFNQLDSGGNKGGRAGKGKGNSDGRYDDDEFGGGDSSSDDEEDDDDDDDDMPDDEMNYSRESPAPVVGDMRAANSRHAQPTGGQGADTPQRRHLDEAIKVEDEEGGGMMSGFVRAMSDIGIGSVDGNGNGNGNKDRTAGGGAAALPSASASGSNDEDAIVPDHEAGFEVDICAYLHNVCGDPTSVADGEAPPPPPPLALPAAGPDDEINTSRNGKAAQLRLPQEQENTAIEVEYVDPDLYESDEEGEGGVGDGGGGGGGGDGEAAGKKGKKKKKGLGRGLGKMFGKSKKKVQQDAAAPSASSKAVETAEEPDRAAAAAAAIAAAAAVGGAAAAVARSPSTEPQDEQQAMKSDSQETADHFEEYYAQEEENAPRQPQTVFMSGQDGGSSSLASAEDDSTAISSTGWSPDEKNAYLEAMAARAKDDYRRSSAPPPPVDDDAIVPKEEVVIADDTSVPEDDYAEWRPSEKRRFLQLLSSGKTPRQAARTIKDARVGAKKAAESGEGTFDSSPIEAAEAEGKVRAAALPTDEAGKDTAEVEEEPGLGTMSSLSEEKGEKDEDMTAAAAALGAGAVAVGAAAAAAVASSRDDSSAQDQAEGHVAPTDPGEMPESESRMPAPALALAPRVDLEDEPADGLDSTGLNYYDAVQRDDPRDFDDDNNLNDISMVSSQASVNKSQDGTKSKRSIRRAPPKSKGFESLDVDADDDDVASEVLSDHSQKKNNFMSLSKLRSAKRGKEGFASLEDDPYDDGESSTANARGLRRSRGVPDASSVPLTSGGGDDKSVGELSSSRESLSAAIMMLRKKPAGFQKVPSEKEGIAEEDVVDFGDSAPTSMTSTQTRDLQQAEDKAQTQSSDRITEEEKKEQPEEQKDDDSIFNFDEDDTVAMGAKAKSAGPTLDGGGDIGPIHASDNMSTVSGLTMNTLNADSMSVATMERSVATAATSSSTKSTRRRHHGAAKKRLSKAKEAEESVAAKNIGWLDSIRAAAANNNRAWDPQLGWVDYAEPDAQNNDFDDAGSAKRIGPLPLASKMRKPNEMGSDDESDVQSTARSVVPFPPEWEKERDAMIEESFESNKYEGDAPNELDLSAVKEGRSSLQKNGPSMVGEESSSPVMNEKSPLIGNESQVDTSASSEPLLVIPEDDSRSDGRSLASALTAHAGTRTYDGTSQKGATPEKSKPVGWHESMKAAARSVSAKDPNKRWDPEHGWVGLPPEAMPATQQPDTADDLDRVLEDVVSAEDKGTRSVQVPGDSETQRNTLDDSRDSRRSGPVDLDEDSDLEEDSDSISAGDDEEVVEDDDDKLTSGESLSRNLSRISTRSGPVDLDDSDFEDDSTDEDDAGEQGQTLGARGVIMSQPESQQPRSLPAQGGQEPALNQDGVSAQDKSRDGLYQFIESSSPEMKSSADNASDEAVGSAKKDANQSQNTAKPAKLDFSKFPRIGRAPPEAMQGYDELASVESERQYGAEDPPQVTSANKVPGDKSNVIMSTHKEIHYEQFNWERTVTAVDGSSAKESADSTAAPQTTAEIEDAKEEAEATTPATPTAPATERGEESTPEVQVIKLKMSEKDKDLFNANNDGSINYIDDSNFAPDFADESPFGTPLKSSESRGIEDVGAKVDVPSWDNDEGDDEAFKNAESIEAKGPPKSRFLQMQEKRRQQELDNAPDPPTSAPDTRAPDTRAPDPPDADVVNEAVDGNVNTKVPSTIPAGNDGSVMTANSDLQGENISIKSGGPSVSSRAKQWMDLMESKSKSRLPSKHDPVLQSLSNPPSPERQSPSPERQSPNPERQEVEEDDNDDSLETKSRASSSVEWPGGSGSSARRSQQAGTEEWKSFLGKKAQAETAAATNRGLVFSAADEGSEIDIGGGGASATGSGVGKARSVASSGTEGDSIFKFDGNSSYNAAESNQLKTELEKMSSSKHRKSLMSGRPGNSGGDDNDLSQQNDVNRSDDEGEKGERGERGERGDKIDKSTFFQRLSACAAPILPRAIDDKSEEVPAAHLTFMQSAACPTDGSQKILKKINPPAFCGRPDTVFEEGDGKGERRTSKSRDAQRTSVSPSQRRSTRRSSPPPDSKRSSRSSPGEGFSEVRASTSSVVSGDGFGAKSAYLEAVALKAATKKSKKRGGRSSSSVASSSVSSSSSKPSSEAWQSFVEKRGSKDAGTSGNTAEQQAAKKVEEMMAAMSMATASKDEIDDMIDVMSNASSTSKPQPQAAADTVAKTRSSGRTVKKSESAKAAEELAASRVEAMMAAMSSAKLDNEGEI